MLVTSNKREELRALLGCIPPDVSDVALWVACLYVDLWHPWYTERGLEVAVVRACASHFGITVSDIDFDMGMAIRFGGGCEVEWDDC